jgi:hypothetical protein
VILFVVCYQLMINDQATGSRYATKKAYKMGQCEMQSAQIAKIVRVKYFQN